MKTKLQIRKDMEMLRNKLTEEEKTRMDLSIYNKVIEHQVYKDAESIFIYVSYRKEVDTHKLIRHALNLGKTVAVPVILDQKREFVAIGISDLDKLKKNKYGILEPDLEQNNIIAAQKFDLAFIPGTAFDNNFGRVGYGAGMYDKYFSTKDIHSYKLALAYHFQVLDRVPMEEFDLRIDELITD
ncbi:5-formyltetrahydrofolate cyclo-ligase [Clostridium oryzae]|uniref:5-formyltetrahydrofolate cyclo-ligase n=1 Tax=Clostridium oryzae TaxID=1450648 RepID=A0A1V4II30_9CLOT|nr:5-formyltetrahydrofolate cyclo-ligase [Clostridium oryzae]OPJ59579.1 5-formyltetrahydrofolate cyclo-ligase family protein [Clostridium oryzae]